MYIYKTYGLIFSSELLIPELDVSEGLSDVEIKIGKIPESLSNPVEKRKFFQSAPNEFLLKLEKIAGFYVKNGNSIIIEPYTDINSQDIRLFLLGSVFGALLQQRGLLVIHGSSVIINGKGVIFTGISGVGKSTLAAAFYKKGYKILTDDVCAIKFEDNNVPYIVPGFPSLKLWKDSADKLGRNTKGLETVKKDIEKYRTGIEDFHEKEPVELSEMYILNTHEFENIKINQIKDMAKLEAVLRNTYRYKYLNGQGMKPLHFKQCAFVAGKIKIYNVHRPKNLFLIDELVCAIEINIK